MPRQTRDASDAGAARPQVRLEGLALTGGKSATGSLGDRELVLETLEPRRLPVIIGLSTTLVVAGVILIGFARAGTLPRMPWFFWLGMAVPALTRRVRRSYPLDAFAAVELRGTTVRLHRRGAARPPLDIALKSWQVTKLADALRARIPAAFDAPVPAHESSAHDDIAELGQEVAEWIPDGHGTAATLGGAALLAAALLLGAFHRLEYVRIADTLSWFAAVAAVVVWGQDRATRAYRDRESRRLAGDAPKTLRVETRRDRRDIVGWLAPWVRTDVESTDDSLVLLHRPIEAFDVVVMAGVACLAGFLIVGSFTPWTALACFVPLLASGYPRRRMDIETILAEHVVALEDTGGRATLHLRDEDGERDVLLRFGSGRGRTFTALVRQLAPDARVREPGWRKAS